MKLVWIILVLVLLITPLGACQGEEENPQPQSDNPQMTAVEVCEYVDQRLSGELRVEYKVLESTYVSYGIWHVTVKTSGIVLRGYQFNEKTAALKRIK